MSTVIRVKYAENIERIDEMSEITSKTPSEAPTGNKELLVNINCNIGLIMDYIREIVRIESMEFDLWEESSNQLKNVCSQKLHVSGLEIFKSNDSYILILVERNSEGQVINYVPLITGKLPRGLSEFITKTKKPGRKKSSSIVASFRDKGGRKKISAKSK